MILAAMTLAEHWPVNLALAAVVGGAQGLSLIEPEFLSEEGRVDVLPAPFLSL